jgi:ferredoxin
MSRGGGPSPGGRRPRPSPASRARGVPPPLETVFSAIEEAGFASRGALGLRDGERVGALAEVRTIALVGVAGPRGWDAFAASPESRDGADDPLDRFSRRVIEALAERFGAVALYPFGGPPYWPFQQWAQRAEPVHPSPLGLLIHPQYGFWHSYRGALGLRETTSPAAAARGPSSCDACHERPCLSACPVGAFTGAGYDISACATRLSDAGGADCLGRGCLARRACPVGAGYAYGPEQASFPMRAFLKAREAAQDPA